MRRRYLLGNWKMFRGPSDAAKLARALKDKFSGPTKADTVAVFPPFVSLAAVRDVLQGSAIQLGAQTLHWEKEGAFTGEVNGPMLADAGGRFVLVAHSERRQLFGETDETANKRVKAALASGLVPVLCVGETLAQRDAGETELTVARHLRGGLAGLSADEVARVVIAYEPVWAIGTGRVATPEQAEAVHLHLRNLLRADHGALADSASILYGGSVKADNARGLLSQANIDGALVGGASLDAEQFAAIGQAFQGN